MKRGRTRNLYGNPLLAWADLALRTGEMMLASAQVIAYRTGRMAAAGSRPTSRDRREFALTGWEKVEVATKSAHAVATHMFTTDALLVARAVQQSLTGAAAMISLAGSRTTSQAIARQARLAHIMVLSVGTGSRIAASSARLTHRGLKPIHSRVTANARRLAKR